MNDDTVLRAPDGLRTELMDDELLLYHEEKTSVIALNSTASLIWQLCDGKTSIGSIRRLLIRAFPEAAERIPAEVDQAVDLLLRERALAVASAAPQSA